VDFADYVQGLMTFLFRSYGGTERSIGLQIDVQGVTLGVDVAIPCGLIINELVSNSLKHAFPGREKGTIRVRMHETEQRFVLELSDDGIGFPRNVDFRNTDSLGLQLVTTLAAQIGARITKQSDQGTSYTITFQNPGY
jgi:two-component sensor histidine kinase